MVWLIYKYSAPHSVCAFIELVQLYIPPICLTLVLMFAIEVEVGQRVTWFCMKD